jgi:hypothetical protein
LITAGKSHWLSVVAIVTVGSLWEGSEIQHAPVRVVNAKTDRALVLGVGVSGKRSRFPIRKGYLLAPDWHITRGGLAMVSACS